MRSQQRLEQLEAMLREEPDDVFLNYALALEYMAAENFDGALSQLQKVTTLDARHIPAYYQMGLLFGRRGETGKALESYRFGLDLAVEKKDLKSAGEFREAIFLLED